ncbi:DUF1512 domain-containing protein [Saccharolobus solfataricus]|uniref:DUF1512 domain-containing protein n=3 Tax=Saccharolobus solfataricus TaxID=2287 RepID=Q7LXZ0_SACS2|nr:DUF1512 domain-containing protein [Saccharolobus solfataricus]AAK40453.1 Conserved hypothetical protein [Saccharolobus solfataricus P2]AKA73439.2 DUF1512 domain-containing protein [Saccharolobus solfataricus]AKA76137.1 DUF1512 domain-containing protein [Saccharolobus solfataricus]AKA78829.2 DUF1512 domain-containing protein [Saccharolobus solfataricus]AZF67904.1 DUF1512 domain-containing protein [Saccharolobus solfataricus]
MSLIALAQTSLNQANSLYYILTYVLFFVLLFLLYLPGVNTRLTVSMLARGIEGQLSMIEKYLNESKSKMEQLLKERGVQDPKPFIERISEMFIIDPVNVEPTDIISRMRLLLRSGEDKIRDLITLMVPNIDNVNRSKLEVSAEVVNSLNLIYKVVRHYLILAKKLNSAILLYQLQFVVPQLVKISEAYSKAMNTFIRGIPVGDSLGPLVAAYLFMKADKKWNPSRDTVAGEVELEGRKLIVVKAEGPMATVGRPGEAVENVVEEYKGKVTRIITIDAALKLEGENTGAIAEGTGVAMGDPGPEKISIERVAVKYNIPIDAVIVKMSMEEAITEMRKEIYQAAPKALELVKKIILERTKPGDIVVVVGVGNTAGVAQ